MVDAKSEFLPFPNRLNNNSPCGESVTVKINRNRVCVYVCIMVELAVGDW